MAIIELGSKKWFVPKSPNSVFRLPVSAFKGIRESAVKEIIEIDFAGLIIRGYANIGEVYSDYVFN